MKNLTFSKVSISLIALALLAVFSLAGCGGGGGGGDTQPPTTVKAKSVSITPIGLGESILVTNTSPITITGVAESDIGIDRVEYFNQATNTKGTASGTNSWAATIALSQGDNKLLLSAYAKDGTKTEISTTITYYQNTDFATSLTLSTGTLYVNESKDATFTIGIGSGANAIVTLYNTDTSGGIQSVASSMKDDGVLPDEIQSDGLFTTKFTLNPSQTGNMCYRVGVAKTDSSPYYSENKCIWVTTHFSNDNISKAVSLADSVKNIYEQKPSLQDAAQAAEAQLKSDPSVGAVNSTEEGGVWWITNDGILGLYHPTISGQKSGIGINKRVSTKPSTAPTYNPEIKPVYYPADYLSDRSHFVPQYLNKKSSKLLAQSSTLKNEIKSTKAIIISPYINNPIDTANSFGQWDDYYVPWETLKDKKACVLQATKEALNNGSINVNLDTFKKLGDYGYIHISSHGDNFYNGLLSLWQDIWGPNFFLSGSVSQVVVYTGIVLPQNADGTYNKTGYEDDLKEKRIAISAGGSIVILPSFIKYYTDKLPNSLVVLSSCRSMYNNSMANAFLAKSAGAVIGYSDYVLTPYAQNTINTVISEMFTGKNIKEAFDQSILINKASDCGGADKCDKDGDGVLDGAAFFRLAGSDTLVLSSGGLKNGGFEDGVLTPWSVSGDGRIITQLGITSPTEGSYMGIISTGLGYTTETGEIQQDFCASTNSKQLSFNWNYFSEEFKEFCGSIFQDTLKVSVCIVDDSTGSESCDVVLDKKVDDLCNSVVKSDVSFDVGDVYNTGWTTQSIDFSKYAGKHVRLKFYATDIGDSIYDTAILLDQIEILE